MSNLWKVLGVTCMALMLFGCLGGSEPSAKITVKQIIPLPTGTIIEASAPVLEVNRSSLDSFLDQIKPRTGENSVLENESFLLPIEIINGNATYLDTTVTFSYTSDYVEFVTPYASNSLKLEQIGANTFRLDRELTSGQTTRLWLAGKAKVIPSGMRSGTVELNLTVYDGNQEKIVSVIDTVAISKKTA